jgi:adenylylsulfate reductase, subunit B
MHIDPVYRRSYNIEPNFCWECYSCVKACPQNAIDVRGYADFVPLGHKVRVLREPEKGSNLLEDPVPRGRKKEFTFPIRTTPWGSIKAPSDYPAPDMSGLASQLLAHKPEGLHIAKLPRRACSRSGKGVMSWAKKRNSSIRTSHHRRRLRWLRGRLRVAVLGTGSQDRPRREGQRRAQRRSRARPVGDQLLHGHAMGASISPKTSCATPAAI